MKNLYWLALVALVACQSPVSDNRSAASVPLHSLTLSWTTSPATAHTLLPSPFPTALTYDVLLHPASGADVTQTGLGVTSWTFNNLASALYTITVTGKDGSGNPILSGTASADMTAAAVQNPSITLFYNSTVGTGSGKIHLTFDCTGTSVATTSVTLVAPSGATLVSNAALAGSSPTFTYTNLSAPVGTYKLFAKFLTGSTYAFKLDSVLVFQNVDTVASITVAPSDFGANYVPVSSLLLSTPTPMYNGQSQTLTATLNAGASNPLLTWSSNAPNVATVNQNGLVTGVSVGTAIITARSIDNTTVSSTASVVVSVAPKDLTAFSVQLPLTQTASTDSAMGVISGTNISVWVPYGTNVSSLVPTFATTGAGVTVGATTQSSGVTPNNFSSPVAYTVTATDSSTKTYTVTVNVAAGYAIVATEYNGTIWSSQDNGATWSSVGTSQKWNNSTASANGTVMFASAGGYAGGTSSINRSVDGGITWTAVSPVAGFGGLATSDNGSIVGAVTYDGSNTFYWSKDAGTTWNTTTIPDYYWQLLQCSSDGTKWLAYNAGASASNVNLFTGTFDGVSTWTWTRNAEGYSSESNNYASGWTLSKSGTKIFMTISGNNNTYLSTDFGVSWPPISHPGTTVTGSTMSGNGAVLVIVADGNLYTSTNAGSTWTLATIPGLSAAGSLATTPTISYDGTRMAFVATSGTLAGGVFVSVNSGLNFGQLASPSLTGHTFSSIVVQNQ